MKTKIVIAGVVSALLLGSLGTVTAYHIDAGWVPVNAATGLNVTCIGFGGSGTDCPNNWARGWVFNANPLITGCEQNQPGGPGQPGTNGMCFASNVKYSYTPPAGGFGVPPCTGPRPGTTNGVTGPQSMAPVFQGGVIGCPGMGSPDQNDWTRFFIFSNLHPSFAPGVCAPPGYDQMDPHDDALSRGGALTLGEAANSPFRSNPPGIAGAVARCVPPNGNIFAQVRCGSNTHGLLLTNGVLMPAGSAINGDPAGVTRTFYYRELMCYWGAGGHITFFVQPGVGGATFPGVIGGSYWAEDNLVGGVMTPPSMLQGCNELYDNSATAPMLPAPSYFDIFEPVTYTYGAGAVGAVPGSTQTVCRSTDPPFMAAGPAYAP